MGIKYVPLAQVDLLCLWQFLVAQEHLDPKPSTVLQGNIYMARKTQHAAEALRRSGQHLPPFLSIDPVAEVSVSILVSTIPSKVHQVGPATNTYGQSQNHKQVGKQSTPHGTHASGP